MTEDRSRKSRSRDTYWDDDEEEDQEMHQRFVEYQLRLAKEEEDKRAQERAAYSQREQEKKKKADEESRQAIEQKAINDYKQEQDEIKAHNVEREAKFKEELVKCGFRPDQIQSIIEIPILKDWSNNLGSLPNSLSNRVSSPHPDEEKKTFDIAPSVRPKGTRHPLKW